MLCTPAFLYLAISVIALVVMLLQNIGNTNQFCIGNFYCSNVNVVYLLLSKLAFILFWTFILNLLCKNGASAISWLFVLVPLIIMFIILALFLTGQAIPQMPFNY